MPGWFCQVLSGPAQSSVLPLCTTVVCYRTIAAVYDHRRSGLPQGEEANLSWLFWNLQGICRLSLMSTVGTCIAHVTFCNPIAAMILHLYVSFRGSITPDPCLQILSKTFQGGTTSRAAWRLRIVPSPPCL